MTKATQRKLDKLWNRIEAVRTTIYSYGDHNMTLAQCKLVAPAELVREYEDGCCESDQIIAQIKRRAA